MRTGRGMLQAGTFGVLVLLAIGVPYARAATNPSPASAAGSETTLTKRVPPKYYRQPEGFGGRKWGEPLKAFNGLGTAFSVEAAWGHRVWHNRFLCIPNAAGGCDFNSFLASLAPVDLSRTLTIVSQHQIEGQGFRMAGVTLHPVTHFFCGQWKELLQSAPKDLEDRMGYCGIRLEFESENEQALATLPPDHVTQYQRILRHLIQTYGKPPGYRGHVTVYDSDTRITARREFPRRYRWCTNLEPILAPKCNVKMTLTFDVESGKGSILMATPPLIQFASAQPEGSRGLPSPLYQELFRDFR